jgi:hypothetical protein
MAQSRLSAILQLAREAMRLADEECRRSGTLEALMVLVFARQFAWRIEHAAWALESDIDRTTPVRPLQLRSTLEPSKRALEPTKRWFNRRH